MSRLLVFPLLGPVFGVLLAFYLVGQGHRDGYGVPIAFFFTLMVCAIAGPVDAVLAAVAPAWLRVPATAIVGAAAAIGVLVGLSAYISAHLGKPMVLPAPHRMIPVAAFGAVITAVCSLLAHDWRGVKT